MIIFKGLSVARNHLRIDSAPLKSMILYRQKFDRKKRKCYWILYDFDFVIKNLPNFLRYKGKITNIFRRRIAKNCFVKNEFIKIPQKSQKNICATVSFLLKMQAEICKFIKKETLAQVFSCEFCTQLLRTPFYITPSAVVSVFSTVYQNQNGRKRSEMKYCNDLHKSSAINIES